jgi:imidazole glycerol-phosphate synthase subunit HisH
VTSSEPRDRAVVVRTGTANLASVMAALRRAGLEPSLSDRPEDIVSARRVVLPGVGSFGAASSELRRRGLDVALRDRASSGRPLLAICLGLQLLCEASEESPGHEGLGVVRARIERLKTDGVIPQLGWNMVEPTPSARLLQRGHAYYANSYRLGAVPEGWEGATTEHGETFAAAIERGPVLACQFHPELSGPWGGALISRWVAATC